MADGNASIVLVCPCGMKLRAPGASPGRLGRCPKCGATLRAPGPAPSPTVAQKPAPNPTRPADAPEPRKPEKRRASAAADPIPYGAGGPSPGADPAEDVLPGRVGPTSDQRKAELDQAARAIGRGGVIPLPKTTSFGLADALLYPIWDGAGLSWLIVMPFGLAGTSLVVFGLIPLVMQGGQMLILGPFAFPMTLTFALAVGYLIEILEAIVAASATGEIHHPRWPEIAFGPLVVGLFRWAIAAAVGFGLGAVPAIAYARGHESGTTLVALTTAGLFASGLIYVLMALAAMILHGDLMAANPITVAKAIFRGGLPYLRTCLVAIAAAVLITWTVRTFFRFEGLGTAILGSWFTCTVIVYLAMVVARMLGLCCRVRSEQLGWFRDRPRWGA